MTLIYPIPEIDPFFGTPFQSTNHLLLRNFTDCVRANDGQTWWVRFTSADKKTVKELPVLVVDTNGYLVHGIIYIITMEGFEDLSVAGGPIYMKPKSQWTMQNFLDSGAPPITTEPVYTEIVTVLKDPYYYP